MARLSTLKTPDPERMKFEMRARPDETPESLLRFAEELAPLMEQAQGSDKGSGKFSGEFAQSLFLFLEACSLDAHHNELAHSARALCLVDSQHLAQAHPKRFERRVRRLSRRVPEHVRLLAAFLNGERG
jgi:hypothetical protein